MSRIGGELVSALSEKQRETLDLTVKGMTSKEIARVLGVSPHTVDQRITLSKKKLGVATRRELVRVYEESRKVYDQAVYHAPDIDSLCQASHPDPGGEISKAAFTKVPNRINLDWFCSDGHVLEFATGMRNDDGITQLKAFRSFILAVILSIFMGLNLYWAYHAIIDVSNTLIH